MTKPEWVSTLKVGEGDMIVLNVELADDAAVDEIVQTLHRHFPNSMVLFLGAGETIEARPEEEVKELLKAILDHQEYREHKELAGG